MNIEKLEEAVRVIAKDIDEGEFVYQFLRAYGQPKASITRLKNGQYNQSKNDGEVLWKKKICFRHEPNGDLHGCIDRLKSDKNVTKHSPRFIIVTDFHTLLALDTKTDDTIDTPIVDLGKHSVFFLPWAGMEKSQIQSESLADIRAAEKMGRLYEMILADNDVKTEEQRHALNIFLSRLLFCFFAEDTEIFESDQFTNGIASHTTDDGSDLQGYLQKLFAVLATDDDDREGLAEYLSDFPYVNGGLFCDDYPVPVFNRKSRKIIIECGTLNWKAINPDIFGSMIQAVVHSEERGQMGMHYTSVVNIMKVIEPLFLNELKEQLGAAGTNKKKLDALLKRLYNLRIFDPACGSGNFLIIAYKELCRLEIEVFNRLGRKGKAVQKDLFRSNLQLTQFYGIELDDFAHETAKLSLWLAEHQMNLEFKSVFGATRPTLPLQEGGNIVCGNATREDWDEVCSKSEESEVFILGNPPYRGASLQSKEQKKDVKVVLGDLSGSKMLDYIACWFRKAANYCQNSNTKVAFVSTNSICQGQQIAAIWPDLLSRLEIGFAHRSFKWSNHARGNAGVTCVIVGLQDPNYHSGKKTLFSSGVGADTANINAYLFDLSNFFVVRRSTTLLNRLPRMKKGSQPTDDGELVLSKEEKEQLEKNDPGATRFIKKYVGSREFINGLMRWCLWIEPDEKDDALKVAEISERTKKVAEFRAKSTKATTVAKAATPHLFDEPRYRGENVLIVPSVSSERRRHLPIGFIESDTVVSNLAFEVYDSEPYLFAVISCQMHLIWARAVGGRLKEDPRYSNTICYNNFPFPNVKAKQKADLEEHVFKVLDEREAYPEQSLAELYDPDKMPESLRDAHHQMDLAVERCYRKKPFSSDEERLEYLFKLYEKMIEEEKQK